MLPKFGGWLRRRRALAALAHMSERDLQDLGYPTWADVGHGCDGC
jgi:hypothetical protein